MQSFKTLQKIRALTSRRQKYAWCIIVAIAIVSSLFEVASALSIAGFVRVIHHTDEARNFLEHYFHHALSDYHIIMLVCIACAVVYVIKNLVIAAEVHVQSKIVQRMCSSFRGKLLHIFSTYSYQKYIQKGAASYLQVFNADIDKMFVIGVTAVASIVSEVMVVLFLSISLFLLNAQLATLIVSLIALVSLGFVRYLLPFFLNYGKQLRSVGVKQTEVLHTFFHGYKDVIVRGMTEHFVKHYFESDRYRAKAVTWQNTFNVVPRLVLECVFMSTFVLIVWYMIAIEASIADMIAILGAYLYIGFRMMPGVNRIMTYASNIKTATPSIDRVHELYYSLTNDDHYLDHQDFSFQKFIVFDKCCFSYMDEVHPAVTGINWRIQKGQKIGIMGHTGSGKSTIIDLLLGILKPSQGSVMIDDSFPAHSRQWQQYFGLVSQNVFLLPGSIRDNILFGHEAHPDGDAFLWDLLKKVRLDAMVNAKPQGLDTSVGEKGVFLSGGEKQRIAIARALYGQPEILLFDEATSALDNETEAAIIESLNQSCQDITVIMIAHRLTTLQCCDSIIKLEAGKIVAQGSYEELCL